ncbi:MAG: heterodisulfide reductase subunit B [Desulforhopalus sp.]|jgi:heterodisulfide reductase subunit B
MKYALFEGCNIPIRIQQYSLAMRAVLDKFDVSLETIDDFNCCGYPVRNVDETAYILPSMRNMAIAESRQLDIFVICNCCFASLQKTKNLLDSNTALKDDLNRILAKEGLKYTGSVAIKHFLTVLHEDVGTERIIQKLSKKFKALNIVVIQGCHILRPREITLFDDSFVPQITDKLLEIIGISSLDWQGKLECCGASLAGINNELSHKLLKEKITGAQRVGAEYIVPICSYCYLQFDTAQIEIADQNSNHIMLPVLLYPQLLGLCLGIEPGALGVTENKTINQSHLDQLLSLLGPPVEEKKKRKKKAVNA